ncbi:nitroreductase family protein [Hungatella effluvii]|uniref:nitroreductase family protein n=2 Tax=Hungatella effluvii TaxID=1096246 RepID=UPI002A809270|nr:nitroreductase family protein [Hungatella effluvii]
MKGKQWIKAHLSNCPTLYRALKKLSLLIGTPSQKKMERMVFRYHRKRFRQYSGCFKKSRGSEHAYLTWLYHVVEKGLAMPEMRFGFGAEKIRELYRVITEYSGKYGKTDPALLAAVSTLLEYERIHEEEGYPLSPEFTALFKEVRAEYPAVEPLNQVACDREHFYCKTNQDFEQFSASRHSVRNFGREPVAVENIIEAVRIAGNAPSACNRQPARVHIVTSHEKIVKCLELQNGNRGFGHLADKLLVVTGDLSTVLGAQEFFDLNTNVGIFIMNLCYALHYKEIAHCVLNWYALPKQDQRLREILELEASESVTALIVCGNVPERFKVVMSPRLPVSEIYVLH